MARQATDVTPLGRRITAAAVLAEMDQEELADSIGVSVRTLRRSLVGKRDFKAEELRRLIEKLEVPDWFLEEGLTGPTAREAVRRRELELELRDQIVRQHDELVGKLESLASEVRALTAADRERRI